MQLSEDQKIAFDAVMQSLRQPGAEAVLAGAAGCGKTTLTKLLIRHLLEEGITPVLAATTGRAALRLEQVTGRRAKTVHKRMFDKPKLTRFGSPEFSSAKAPCGPGDALIVDEASMMGKKLYDKLMGVMPSTARVLFVGDHEQLPPVDDVWGPNLRHPTGLLTQVHRQALDSNIISYATAIREGRGEEWEEDYAYQEPSDDLLTLQGSEASVDWYLEKRKAGEEAVLITYTHKVRKDINKMIRDHYGREDLYDVKPGDQLVVKTNNKVSGLRNGEVVLVKEVLGITYEPQFKTEVYNLKLDDDNIIRVPLAFIEADGGTWWRWKSFLPKGWGDDLHHVHHGHCLTVHSCQGSQFDNVVFLEDSSLDRLRDRAPDEARRFQYTAVTRAVKRLRVAFL